MAFNQTRVSNLIPFRELKLNYSLAEGLGSIIGEKPLLSQSLVNAWNAEGTPTHSTSIHQLPALLSIQKYNLQWILHNIPFNESICMIFLGNAANNIKSGLIQTICGTQGNARVEKSARERNILVVVDGGH